MHFSQRKVIFLDRDGVINKERGEFTWKLEDFILNDHLFEALNILKKNAYEFVIISNQSGIARGLYNFDDVEFLHHQLIRIAASNGIKFLEIYYCPHHPDKSRCICRKPGSLMLEKAIARFNVDKTKSWFIGDAERDIEAANKAGIQSILIQANSSLLDIVPLLQ
ncbi:MAG TPA: HAD family hydrolase [Bacteroidia bacterium]|nr:HAD family hydrolase [Bacteroidia bacterium]HNS11146.1 HAD family hydrolase [Bacteroidia bacterium]